MPSFPATSEERADALRRIRDATGLDLAVLERLVRSFYKRARVDPEIGPKFAQVADWDTHIANITAFWSSVALMSGRYQGQPMAAHVPLELRGPHFTRWLTLFEQTARETCSEAAANYLMEKARRIAASLEMGTSVARGELPSRNGSGLSFEPETSPLLLALLKLLRAGRLTGVTEEAVVEELVARFPGGALAEAWRVAIGEALRAGYIHDPVRLESGSLQCRWRLELTSQGFKAAQK